MPVENGSGAWRSNYPKRHFYFLGVFGLILAVGIIVLEAVLLRDRDDIRWQNILIPASITGTAFGIFFVLLSILVLCVAKTKSRCLAITFLIMSLLGFLLDIALLTFHGLHLISRCNPSQFDGIINTCRNEFDNVLMILRHGNTLLLLVIAVVVHTIITLSSIILSSYVLCRSEEVEFESSKRSAPVSSRRHADERRERDLPQSYSIKL